MSVSSTTSQLETFTTGFKMYGRDSSLYVFSDALVVVTCVVEASGVPAAEETRPANQISRNAMLTVC